MQATTQYTEAGKADLFEIDGRPVLLARLDRDGQGTRGSVTIGRLYYKGQPDTYCLFWEWGGDWMVFGDGAEYDAEQIDGWEPEAIREAVTAAVDLIPESAADMQWFLDWADAAEKTLSAAHGISLA